MATRKGHKRNNRGTVISGTMRPEDLIPAFLDELRAQTPMRRAHMARAVEIANSLKQNQKRMDHEDKEDYFRSDQCEYDLEWLFDALQEYASAYFYFGAHPGNGSDYGYWLSEEFGQDFVDDGGLKVSDISEIPANHEGEVLEVNDHGNMTLYRRARNHRLYELWSVV